jgi:broad specificity phosphatase PhoE
MSNSNIQKVIYFVRHGESEHNVAPVFQSPDSHLSTIGQKQARSIAERLCRLKFDTLISSSFARAKETAEFIADATKKSIEYSDLFVERIKPTYINGKSVEDVKANKLWREWEESLYTSGLKVEDGENFDDLVARADKALSFLHDRPEHSVAVVTHGFFLRTILARVLLGDLLSHKTFRSIQKSASMENTGVSVIRLQGGFEEAPRWRLWIYNDHAHLD